MNKNKEIAIKLLKEGLSRKEVAEKLGISRVTLGAWAIKEKLFVYPSPKVISNEDKLKGLEMLKVGISQAEVAKVFGITRAAVNLWAKAAGIPSKRFKTASTKIKAINLIKEGKSKTEVARVIEVHRASIHDWCQKTNTPYVRKQHQFYSDEFKTNAMNLIRGGKSKLSVAKLLGVTYKILISGKLKVINVLCTNNDISETW